MTQAELQAMRDARVARYANPDYTPQMGLNGRIWTRTHPLRCACGNIFLAFQPEDTPFEPYSNPDPPEGKGMRLTCGNPICHEAEVKRRQHGDPNYRAAAAAYFSAKDENKGQQKVTNLRRLQ